jgi:hypothetical protein
MMRLGSDVEFVSELMVVKGFTGALQYREMVVKLLLLEKRYVGLPIGFLHVQSSLKLHDNVDMASTGRWPRCQFG